jgi:outer membrane protein, multidrug efflux system
MRTMSSSRAARSLRTMVAALLDRMPPAVLLLTLSGCMMVGPNFNRPDVDLPNAYAGATSTSAPLEVPENWWQLYGDPTLDKLVIAGLERSVDVRRAIARIEEAEALVREANAATLFPQVDVDSAVGRSRSGGGSNAPATTRVTRNNFLLSARTSFELDFWGGLRRTREAAIAQYVSTRYARDVVSLSLAAAIAQTYFTIRMTDAQIAVSLESFQSAGESLEIARSRAQAGLVSDLDINQAGTLRSQIAAQITELRRLRALAEHQLGVLTGILDLTVPVAHTERLPRPPLPPAGLPSALLERRPDIRQAEELYRSANAQIGVARAAQLPTFSLTGALGTQSSELGSIFSTGSALWSFGVGIVGPIFDAGRSAARTDQAVARAQQAAADYEKTAQTAFREVSDALSNVQLSAEAERELVERVDYARNSLRLSTLRYESGYSAYIEVLDAQRTLNEAQLALARNRQVYLQYTVDLMNALGGGWTPGAAYAASPAAVSITP